MRRQLRDRRRQGGMLLVASEKARTGQDERDRKRQSGELWREPARLVFRLLQGPGRRKKAKGDDRIGVVAPPFALDEIGAEKAGGHKQKRPRSAAVALGAKKPADRDGRNERQGDVRDQLGRAKAYRQIKIGDHRQDVGKELREKSEAAEKIDEEDDGRRAVLDPKERAQIARTQRVEA